VASAAVAIRKTREGERRDGVINSVEDERDGVTQSTVASTAVAIRKTREGERRDGVINIGKWSGGQAQAKETSRREGSLEMRR
jgi:hypothetical protein